MKLFNRCFVFFTTTFFLFTLAFFSPFFHHIPFFSNLAYAGFGFVSSPSPSNDANNLQAVSSYGANNAWAVGSYQNADGSFHDLIEHWDGTNWTVQTGANPGANGNYLSGVKALSATSIWAVGSYIDENFVQHALVEHSTDGGITWIQDTESYTGSGELAAIDGDPLSGDAWAVGTVNGGYNGNPLTLQLVNGHFSLQTNVDPNTGVSLTSISEHTNNDIWAVGIKETFSNSQPFTMHYDGNNWTAYPIISTNDNLYGVTAIAADNAWAIGIHNNSGVSMLNHWNGSSWSTTPITVAIPDSFATYLHAVTATSPNDIWAAGEYWKYGEGSFPLIWHSSDGGENWSQVLVESPYHRYLAGLSGIVKDTINNNIWTVGDNQYYQSDAGHWYQKTLVEQPKTPLVFIPGIMGSKFSVTGSQAINPIIKETLGLSGNCVQDSVSWTYNQGDLVWINENPIDFLSDTKAKISNPCSNYLDVLQLNSNGQPVYPQVGLNGDIIHSVYNDGTTNTTIPYLEQHGYTLNEDLFTFPYDWRKDIASSETQLEASISAIITRTGSSRVDMVAHSMGGLLARNYIRDAARAEKVHALVELGTPHAGSPEFLAQLLYNACPLKKFIFFCVPNGQEANKLVQNFPGGFELLPGSLYYQLYPNNYPFSDDRDIDANSVTGPLNYNQLHTLLSHLGKNMNAFNTADSFHNDLDPEYANTHGVLDYLIAGSGQATIGQLHDYIGTNMVNLIRVPELKISQDADSINGDGTVPLLSATLNYQSNVYYTNQNHSNLPTGAALQMAVNLLHGITDPNAVPDNAIRTTPFDYNGRIIGIYSPAQLDVYDDQNNHTGITSDGTAEENIPGSFYEEIGEAKFIYLPDGGHYHLTTKATGTGSFDLKIKNYTNSQLSQANLYLNVEQTASTTGSMNLDTTNPILTVDVNGDGTNIQQIPPAYTLTGNDVYDIAPPVTTAKLSSSQNTSGNYVDPGTVMLIATPSAGFNIAHTYYKIDNGLQQTYSSPFPVSGAGNHTIVYWSIDNAGLTEIQNTKTFTVASTVIAQDTFHRANQNHWGTASDGQAWTADANTNNSFAINNNAGNVNGGGITYSAILGTSATDAQVLFTGSMSNFTDSNIGAVLRWTDANNWYKAFIDGTNLIIRKKVNGTDTTLATILFTSSANTNYSLRFQVVGATLSAKVWQTGQTEPDDWMITVTDNSFSSGYCGLRMIAQSGKTAAYTSFIATNLSGNPIPTPTLTPAPTPGITIAQDTFHRTDQTKWGTASDGQAWGADANTNNKFSIMNNTGQQTNGNGTTYTGILGTTSTDAQIIFTGSMSNYTNSNLGGVLRFTNGDNWYKVHIDGGNLVIQKKVNGTTTILNSIVFTATAGTNYSLRFQIAGNMLQAKVWQTGQTEPANWMATVTDNTFSSGYCGLRMLTQSGITATYTSFAATSL